MGSEVPVGDFPGDALEPASFFFFYVGFVNWQADFFLDFVRHETDFRKEDQFAAGG